MPRSIRLGRLSSAGFSTTSMQPLVFFGGGIRPEPSSVAPDELDGLVCWLDGDDSDNITQLSNVVSQWSDKSGNGNHFIVDSPSSSPTYSSTGLNSKGTVTLGGSQFLKHTNDTDLSHLVLIMVVNVNTSQDAGCCPPLFDVTWHGDNGSSVLSSSYSSGSVRGGTWWKDGASSSHSSFTKDSTWHVMAIKYSAAIGVRSIGNQEADGSTTTYFADRMIKASFAEIAMYTSSLTNKEINLVCQHFASKWGLTVSTFS